MIVSQPHVQVYTGCKAGAVTAYGARSPLHSLLSPFICSIVALVAFISSITNEESEVSLKCCSSVYMLPVRTAHTHPVQSSSLCTQSHCFQVDGNSRM